MTMLRAGGLLGVLTPSSDRRQESVEKMERRILGFRICIGFGLAVPPLPRIVFQVCLYNGFSCCGFLCARLMSVSFPATTPRATTPVQIHSSQQRTTSAGLPHRATTLHTNVCWVQAGYHTCGWFLVIFPFIGLIRRCFHNNNHNFPPSLAHIALTHTTRFFPPSLAHTARTHSTR